MYVSLPNSIAWTFWLSDSGINAIWFMVKIEEARLDGVALFGNC